MNQDSFRRLVSGERCSLGAVLLRFLLGIASQVYSIVITGRNFLYSNGLLKIHHADAAVISVGNITTGGTGKTPLVIRLCKQIMSNSQCAILTRGYKATKNLKLRTQNYENEPAILAESCPGIQVVVNPDRVAGAAEAVSTFGAKVLIMDDGFQHRRLARDLDIVTIDATVPFGYGKLLPAGLLREPVAALKRADAAVITRSDQSTEAELTQLEDKLQQINPEMVIARSIHAPVCVKSIGNGEIALEELKSKKIFAFCGIGNPDAFFKTVKELGTKLIGSKIYNDHYHYTDDCLADIYEQAKHIKADLILTTQKDWFSSPLSAKTNANDGVFFAYLAIELKFVSGEDKITQLIEDALAGKI
ncbi:MAG: tetraacyldisaccharide 4'-kinase [Planctomycetes bacterium]|nr:tetraacyldisaccharide 4'-kinase [Planctomycetota bacterium]